MHNDESKVSVGKRVRRRSGKERRSGIDTRSDDERRLLGERRSNEDRRSGLDRRLNTAADFLPRGPRKP